MKFAVGCHAHAASALRFCSGLHLDQSCLSQPYHLLAAGNGVHCSARVMEKAEERHLLHLRASPNPGCVAVSLHASPTALNKPSPTPPTPSPLPLFSPPPLHPAATSPQTTCCITQSTGLATSKTPLPPLLRARHPSRTLPPPPPPPPPVHRLQAPCQGCSLSDRWKGRGEREGMGRV